MDVKNIIRNRIRNAPSFEKLKAATCRFYVSLYGKGSPHIAELMAEVGKRPEKLLTAHAGVMNARSTRAKTMHHLSRAVIQEAGLPTKPSSKFRGEGERIDWVSEVLRYKKGSPRMTQ